MKQITPSKKRELANKLAMAYDYVNKGDYSTALELFDYILEYLDNPIVYMDKSVILLRLERYVEALKTLDLAEYYQDKFEVSVFEREKLWGNRGAIYLALGNLNKAKECFNIALRFNPNDNFAKEGLKMCK